MPADPVLAALDDALGCPLPRDLTRSDRLALALWWLIDSVAEEFQMPFEQAAVVMLCDLAKESFGA